VAAFFGFMANEIVIGATAMLYGASEEKLPILLGQYYDPLIIYAYMVFILVCVPCIVTLAAIKQETGSWKWTIFTVLYEILLAYGLGFLIVYLSGLLVGREFEESDLMLWGPSGNSIYFVRFSSNIQRLSEPESTRGSFTNRCRSL